MLGEADQVVGDMPVRGLLEAGAVRGSVFYALAAQGQVDGGMDYGGAKRWGEQVVG